VTPRGEGGGEEEDVVDKMCKRYANPSRVEEGEEEEERRNEECGGRTMRRRRVSYRRR